MHTPVGPGADPPACREGCAGVVVTTRGVFTGVHQVVKQVVKPSVGAPVPRGRINMWCGND